MGSFMCVFSCGLRNRVRTLPKAKELLNYPQFDLWEANSQKVFRKEYPFDYDFWWIVARSEAEGGCLYCEMHLIVVDRNN